MRFLAILAAALAFTAAAAPTQAELGDSLYSLTERTTVHGRPGADEPVVMQVERDQELVENQRLGPGTHELLHTCSWSDDCENDNPDWPDLPLTEGAEIVGWALCVSRGMY